MQSFHPLCPFRHCAFLAFALLYVFPARVMKSGGGREDHAFGNIRVGGERIEVRTVRWMSVWGGTRKYPTPWCVSGSRGQSGEWQRSGVGNDADDGGNAE